MRRLIICADGTWNSDDDKAARRGRSTTNVVKMRDAIDLHPPSGTEQKVFYDRGVGVEGNFIRRALGGAFGDGLSGNVRDCYRFLIQNFRPGDQLFFFGFSRGAFTVRSLAGLVRKCGILRTADDRLIEKAYDFYRDGSEETRPAGERATRFRAQHSHETRIRCLGVWDTVGSLGVPTSGPIGMYTRRKYGFHDVRLSSQVENAFHALAIDERRKPFAPTLWQVRESDLAKHAGQRVEQRWFAGVHSNVGGGYPDCGLSDLTFQWMADRAQECGLELKPGVRDALKCDCAGELVDSMTPFFKVLGAFDRVINAPQKDPETGERMHTFEDVDSSVVERFAGKPPKPYRTAAFLNYWRSNAAKWDPPHRPPAA